MLWCNATERNYVMGNVTEITLLHNVMEIIKEITLLHNITMKITSWHDVTWWKEIETVKKKLNSDVTKQNVHGDVMEIKLWNNVTKIIS